MTRSAIFPALLLLLAGCGGGEARQEEAYPGAASNYLDNLAASGNAADEAAIANGADRISPAGPGGTAGIGGPPLFSPEPVPPRNP